MTVRDNETDQEPTIAVPTGPQQLRREAPIDAEPATTVGSES